MNKRTFIKFASVFMASPFLSPLNSKAQQQKLKNWSGNLEYGTSQVSYPGSVAEVQELVQKTSRLKVLGTRHCFNTIADSRYHLLSTKNLNKIISLDTAAGTVTVEAGITYGALCPYLHSKGYALHNLASLPHISVGGACATATHGSGVKNKNLSSAVTGLEMVMADGTLRTLSISDGDPFNAAVVALGALGVVTKLTLEIQPAFMMRQYVYENLPFTELKVNFDKIMSAGYSVSLFTDWESGSINEVWIKELESAGTDFSIHKEFYGATAALKNMHPIAAISAKNCTEQMGVAGPWFERLPHFRMGFTPSSGAELQSEYFVPRQHAVEAILAVSALGERISPHLLISEIRSIDADNLWMSPCYQQPCGTIHFTWKQEWAAVSKLLPLVEKALAPFDARPHWGKLFTMAPTVLHQRYKKLREFRSMIAEYDPKGKFQNQFLHANL